MLNTIRPLPPLLAKKAIEELNETPEKIQEYIKLFRDWILMQPHLNSRTDDEFLLGFLRGCKYSLEKAKKKLDLYYTIRTAMPEKFTNRDINDPKTLEYLRIGLGFPLPKPNGEDGPLIFIARPGIFDTNMYHIRDLIKYYFFIADLMAHEDCRPCIAGCVGLLDCANFKASHLMQYDPNTIKKLMVYFQDSLPVRIKSINVINLPAGVETFVNLVKKFINEKNQSKIFIHGSNLDSLYEQIPKHLLPKEYGGETSTIPEIIENVINRIREINDILKEEEKYGVDEKKRLGPEVNSETLFGISGSFRKLDFD